MIIDRENFGEDLTIAIQWYALYGRIHNGEFNAIPGVRGRNLVTMDKSQYHTTFDGYTVSLGIGPLLIVECDIPFYIGINLNYTFTKFQFDHELPLYESDHTSFGAIAIEFVGGICF